MLKKVIISVSLVVILAIGAIGGTVLAAPPPDDSPRGTWTIIAEGIEEILMELGLITGELGNVSRIESAQGILVSTENESDVWIYESSNFTQGAHFQVTIQAQNVTAFESIKVIRGWREPGHYYSTATSYNSPGFYTIEFDAYKCGITYISKTDDGDPLLQFGWGVTATHAP